MRTPGVQVGRAPRHDEGIEGFQIVLTALLVSVAGFNALASRTGVPYPIVLVIGGLVIGVIPPHTSGRARSRAGPARVLPPLLYVAAFFSDLRALRADARALSLTSIALVLASMAAVAGLAHATLELPWAMAFALGARRAAGPRGNREGALPRKRRCPAGRHHREGVGVAEGGPPGPGR